MTRAEQLVRVGADVLLDQGRERRLAEDAVVVDARVDQQVELVRRTGAARARHARAAVSASSSDPGLIDRSCATEVADGLNDRAHAPPADRP